MSFRRGLPGRIAMLGIAGVGAALLVYGLPGRSWIAILVGALLVAIGLSEATRRIITVTPEGLVVARGGMRGIDLVIRWSSIRDLQLDGDSELALELLDNSWRRVRIGALSDDDCERLLAEIRRRIGHG